MRGDDAYARLGLRVSGIENRFDNVGFECIALPRLPLVMNHQVKTSRMPPNLLPPLTCSTLYRGSLMWQAIELDIVPLVQAGNQLPDNGGAVET